MSATMPVVWFIRHGESEANAGLPTMNLSDTPLTEAGHWQAQQIAQAFEQPPALIITSPYWRTQQTAKPTRERFPSVPHAEWPIQEFSYLSLARYRDSTVEQRRAPSDLYWQKNDPFYVDGEGAESFAEFMGRIQVTQSKLMQLEEEFSVGFSHGRFIQAFLWTVLTRSTAADSERMRQFHSFIHSFAVPNGSILKLRVESSEIWFNGIHTTHLLHSH
jgi:2,3-bisphosphoglycerate-dependent phosphoglycerate mutase